MYKRSLLLLLIFKSKIEIYHIMSQLHQAHTASFSSASNPSRLNALQISALDGPPSLLERSVTHCITSPLSGRLGKILQLQLSLIVTMCDMIL